MKRSSCVVAALAVFAVALTARPAAAQEGRFELTPMIGYRIMSDITDTDTASYAKLEFSNPATFGLAAGWNLRRDTAVELYYNYASSDVTAVPRSGLVQQRTFNVKVHDILVNGLYMFNTGNDKFRPFMELGLGAAIVAPDNNLESLTRFAFSLGGGIKYYTSDRIGFRGEVRWLPVYLYSTEGGTWCDPFYGCYYVSNDHLLSMWDFKAGIIFRF
jgi:outer membrane protein W